MRLYSRGASAPSSGEAATAVEVAPMLGRRYLTPLIAGGDIDALPAPSVVTNPVERLTPREREVVQLLAGGRSMKQAADALGITARTVAFQSTNGSSEEGPRSWQRPTGQGAWSGP